MNHLYWLHGQPDASGQIKSNAADFIVDEDLGFAPDGNGEQILVHISKQNCNTRFVADALAHFCQIPKREVSFAGQKDRHAITRQWFCLHLPGKSQPDFSRFSLEGCQILEHARHRRKLRPGTLRGNYFTIILRQISQQQTTEQRLQLIAQTGVPNYFGVQRFGLRNNNLSLAAQWAQTGNAPRNRQQRSFALSAARSLLFNQIASQRLKLVNFHQVMDGDALQLSGRGSWFVAPASELAQLQPRVDRHELLITAPLPGSGDWGSQRQAQVFEQQCIAHETDLQALLEKEKVQAARRALLVFPRDLRWCWLNNTSIEIRFWLPAGSFATSVIRELINTTNDDANFIE